MVKTVLACIGGSVLFLTLLGMFNIGNFVMMYDAKKISCVKEV
jgi:hypothetical protein